MRREPLFSRSGYYRFLLDCNALLHREASVALRAALSERLPGMESGRTVRVLDLACGGLPQTIAEAMGDFPDFAFDYIGVDLNPDQVSQAGLFRFPENVTAVRILEGNAWDLEDLDLGSRFDLVYSGMNLHHGTPEEIRFLGLQLWGLLDPTGLFISHDVYRPVNTPYRRRPDSNPADASESWRLVAPGRLRHVVVGPAVALEDGSEEEPFWRLDYLRRMREALMARGGDAQGAESTVAHMRERDYPISLDEFRHIFEDLGFRVDAGYYDAPGAPMAPYIGFCMASRDKRVQ